MDIQWYPGHMAKAKRNMYEDIKLVDLIIELVDARAPRSSANPDLSEIGKNKARLVLMNKADLADETENKKWADCLNKNGIVCMTVDSRNRGTFKELLPAVFKACENKMKREKDKGIKNRAVKAMVVGIPNVGKSTFINTYAGKAAAKTGNRPGVTKGKQWINPDRNIMLLDTPGVLWAKFEDSEVGIRLALIGSIKDEILNIEELSLNLIDYIVKNYPGVIEGRFGISENLKNYEILYNIGRKRGCLSKGSEISCEKTASMLLDEFRKGKLGRITLEKATNNDI